MKNYDTASNFGLRINEDAQTLTFSFNAQHLPNYAGFLEGDGNIVLLLGGTGMMPFAAARLDEIELLGGDKVGAFEVGSVTSLADGLLGLTKMYHNDYELTSEILTTSTGISGQGDSSYSNIGATTKFSPLKSYLKSVNSVINQNPILIKQIKFTHPDNTTGWKQASQPLVLLNSNLGADFVESVVAVEVDDNSLTQRMLTEPLLCSSLRGVGIPLVKGSNIDIEIEYAALKMHEFTPFEDANVCMLEK